MKINKAKILKDHGWHQFYSNTHWVHKEIKDLFEKDNKIYLGTVDYTNYQMTLDEAFELCKKYQ